MRESPTIAGPSLPPYKVKSLVPDVKFHHPKCHPEKLKLYKSHLLLISLLFFAQAEAASLLVFFPPNKPFVLGLLFGVTLWYSLAPGCQDPFIHELSCLQIVGIQLTKLIVTITKQTCKSCKQNSYNEKH